MTTVISRSAWGAKPWTNTPRTVAASQRTEFFVHYHGGRPRNDRGDANAKEIEAIHLANGWSGVGYSFIVGQDGAIREGRGWNLQGAHCPGHNVSGWAAYVAIGGDQEPSDAALASVRWLYDEGCRRAGRTLAKRGHRDGIATACPGDNLYRWVKAGMPDPTPAPTPTAPPEDDMFTDADSARLKDLEAAVKYLTDVEAGRYSVSTGRYGHQVDLLRGIAEKVGAPVDVDEDALATALAERIAPHIGGDADLAVLKQAVKDALKEGVA